MLKRPLWFVTEKDTVNPQANPRCETYAFSNFGKLTDFLAHSNAKAWDVVQAADRTALIIVIADAHMRGGDAVYLDPDVHGQGGECIFLTNLMMME